MAHQHAAADHHQRNAFSTVVLAALGCKMQSHAGAETGFPHANVALTSLTKSLLTAGNWHANNFPVESSKLRPYTDSRLFILR